MSLSVGLKMMPPPANENSGFSSHSSRSTAFGDLGQEVRFRHPRMFEPGERKLADAEEPVRAANPLHVEVIAIVERQRRAGAHQLVWNDAVVDARDGRELAVAAIEQAAGPPG